MTKNKYNNIKIKHMLMGKYTTKKLGLYNVHSKTVMRNRLRMSRGDNFLNNKSCTMTVL